MQRIDDILGIRTKVGPGDLGEVIRLHGVEYARECGFDLSFEAYVAGSIGEAFRRFDETRDRIWLAESKGRIIGVIGIVGLPDEAAQLRWYLVAREARGLGLGRRLLEEALAFCRSTGRRRVILWTVRSLQAAARLYRSAGFRLVEEIPRHQWGTEVVEQRYELNLD